MSYEKAMKHVNSHKKDRFYQPIFGMPFKEGEQVESYASIANRTAESYHVRAKINDDWVQVSEDFKTEDNAIDESRELDQVYGYTRIYSDKGFRIAG